MFFRSLILKHFKLLFCIGLALLSWNVNAEELRVAVASNFLPTMRVLGDNFEKNTNHKLIISTGSSGKFVAQILQGANYDLFFSADQQKIIFLNDKGVTVPDTQWTYAIGALALWSNRKQFFKEQDAITRLTESSFNKLAVANPRLAPYGAAAIQTLEKLALYEKTQEKIVMGENISQTFQFVETANADMGFVALSHLLHHAQGNQQSTWLVPMEMYDPINQDAVLLKNAKNENVAREFIDFMQSDTAVELIRSFGYNTKAKESDDSDQGDDSKQAGQEPVPKSENE